jgi:hypothetical protein
MMPTRDQELHIKKLKDLCCAAGITIENNLDAVIENARHKPLDAEYIVQALISLNEADILTQDNFDAVMKNAQDDFSIAWALNALKSEHILTQKNFDTAITSTPYAANISRVLIYFNEAKIVLTPENLNILITYAQYADNIVDAFKSLNQEHILTADNWNAVATSAPYTDADDIAWALIFLDQAKILTAQNRNAVTAKDKKDKYHITLALQSLKQVDILTQNNFDAIIKNAQSQYIENVAKALGFLKQVGILTQENFDAVMINTQYAQNTAEVLEFLNRDLLTKDNFNAIIANAPMLSALSNLKQANILNSQNEKAVKERIKYITGIAKALCVLKQADILNQENFDLIIAFPKNAEKFVFFVQKEKNQVTVENFRGFYQFSKYLSESYMSDLGPGTTSARSSIDFGPGRTSYTAVDAEATTNQSSIGSISTFADDDETFAPTVSPTIEPATVRESRPIVATAEAAAATASSVGIANDENSKWWGGYIE